MVKVLFFIFLLNSFGHSVDMVNNNKKHCKIPFKEIVDEGLKNERESGLKWIEKGNATTGWGA